MEAKIIKTGLTQKTALVCGASQGIGRAAAETLAGQGARVIALARSREKLDDLIQNLPDNGHLALIQDLADRDGLQQQVEQVLARVGTIHILINNTGGPKPGPLHEAGDTHFLEGFGNHILAASRLTQCLLAGMKEAGYGRIINVISTSVKMPIANLGVSNTIRGAMANWAKTMATELGPFGITVNNVLPGYTKTPRLAALIRNSAGKLAVSEDELEAQWRATVPLRRFGEPEEVAAAIGFLASPAAAYINGINLPVDGGRTGCL